MNRAILLVVLFCSLAAAFRNYEEFQTVLPGMWQGTATSLLGTTRTVQMVFTSDGHYSCHVIIEDTTEIDDWSGESCFEEGIDYDSWLKTYYFNYDSGHNFIDGSFTLVDADGVEMFSDVDLVVTTHIHEEDQLFFRVKSPRSRTLHTFFTLKKIASEEDITPCEDYCGGEGYCYFYSGVCSNDDLVIDSWSLDSSSVDKGGVCLFTILIIVAVLTCLCCCCCKMCRRRCRSSGWAECHSRCSTYRCNYSPVPQDPQVPSEPYPGFFYMPMFPPQGPSAPMYMPLTEGAPVPSMAPPYVVVPMMAPEN